KGAQKGENTVGRATGIRGRKGRGGFGGVAGKRKREERRERTWQEERRVMILRGRERGAEEEK
ncbi:hypothetical protein NQ640_19660, partial [Acinetobacter baumannii]|nr:hypothetical protein [Acinetobacter baumannii]